MVRRKKTISDFRAVTFLKGGHIIVYLDKSSCHFRYCFCPERTKLHHQVWYLHCNENPIYVFLFWELQGLSPNFHIYVSVSDFYIPRMDPQISWSKIGRSIVGINKSLTDTWMWKLGLWPRNSFSGNIFFEFFGIGSLQSRENDVWITQDTNLFTW